MESLPLSQGLFHQKQQKEFFFFHLDVFILVGLFNIYQEAQEIIIL